jgi:hypothetical protein
MKIGLSNRAAAKLAGCTHKAIGDAKEDGHLSALPDGSVTAEAVQEWMKNRRAPRGGYQRGYQREVSGKVDTSAPVSTYPVSTYPDVPSLILNLACCASGFAEDAALAMLPHLPEAKVKAFHADLLAQHRRSAVDLLDDRHYDNEPPAGYGCWGDHPLFNEPVSVDWAELRREAGL